jgi:hypothetical protein
VRTPLVAAVVLAAVAALLAVELTTASTTPKPKPVPRSPVVDRRLEVVRQGARPLQFIVSSFDGSGGARLWAYWRNVAKAAHAHFTFFLSGVYLVDWAQHDDYAPPDRPAGDSAIGFAPDAAWIAATRRQVVLGYREGNEIGTHYNGHFCGAGGVGTWTAAEWSRELDEFDHLLFDRGPKLPFGRAEIVGGRTPCLEGNLDVLYPVLARHGFRYDASHTAVLGTWPTRIDGIWSFPLLEIPFIGHSFRVVSMDYNFMANQIQEDPAQIESETYRSLWNAFRASYLGNRAPLSLGNHFETWESWAYDHALTRFLERACWLPEVRCGSFRELADWLDAAPRKRLARWREGRFHQLRAGSLKHA